MKFSNRIFISGQVPVINKLIEKPLDISEAYKLVKFVKSLKEKEEVFLKAKLTIFENYGKKDKEGNITIEEKNREKAAAEMDELLEIEEKYDLASKVVILEDTQMSAAELILLEDIIEIPNCHRRKTIRNKDYVNQQKLYEKS